MKRRFNSSGDIAFDSFGNLFLSAIGASSDQLVSLDSSTGAGAAIGSFGFGGVYGLNFANSTLYGFTSDGETISINTATGVGTSIATNGISAFGADGVGGVSVPEPASVALFGLGLAGLGFSRRKRA